MLNKQNYSVGRGLCGFLNERQFISLKSLSAHHLYFSDLIFTLFCEIFLPDDGKQGLVWGIMHVCPRRALIVTFASSLAPFVFVAHLGRAENPQCTQLWTAVIWLTNNKPPNCTQRFRGAIVLMETMRRKGTFGIELNSWPIGGNHPN